MDTVFDRKEKSDDATGNDALGIPRKCKPKRIAVMGAGPKAMAIAAKAHVLRQLGIADIEVVVIDAVDIAANWDGEHGHTDGDHRLGTPAEKDIGYPYRSVFGPKVDSETFRFTFGAYLVSKGRYGPYVDRGKPHPHHARWAAYLRWVAKQIGLVVVRGRITEIEVLDQGQGVLLTCQHVDGSVQKHRFDGVVITGPGAPNKIGAHDWNEAILSGAQYWQRKAVFAEMGQKAKRVALIGGGETAASVAIDLVTNSPGLSVDIVTRHATLYTRGESYSENAIYSDPTLWLQMEEIDREDFIRRTDRGVFSVEAQKVIDQVDTIRVITGNVQSVAEVGKNVRVNVRRGEQTKEYSYDKVIIATGSDALSWTELLPAHQRHRHVTNAKGERVDLTRDIRGKVDWNLRVPVPFDGESVAPVHVPMLAGTAQGPGFPNLSCLGVLSDRILSAYVPEELATELDGVSQQKSRVD
ncbi:SidA/IucD/PvdA family monooxygenase [Paucibacter sp. R3-3]|uniref:SidA/IucD/PvdA family monooxygenase n=1 Tax=Roseateles agri TaxID=3098619 RepID=A0ABU5DQV3_9BURK|nr:SidA/IucD/PvdA family monooxygenase [Paucibacter sp. R3-3]MDY0748702.1 SidA/IucD/PvdA family monooxygenase [Paucibacter sp. R3-3]